MASPPSIKVDVSYSCEPPSSEQERASTPPRVFVELLFSKEIITPTMESVEEYIIGRRHSFGQPQEAIDQVPEMLRDAMHGIPVEVDLSAQSTKLQTYMGDSAQRESGRESLTFDVVISAKQKVSVEYYDKVMSPKQKIDEEGSRDCAVCLDELYPKTEEGSTKEVINLLFCNHGFHLECITEWLLDQSTCPICRSDVG